MDISLVRKHVPGGLYKELPSCIERFAINKEERLAHFLGQCHHESQGFTRLRENLNYSEEGLLKTFPKYFTPETAKIYAHKPVAIGSRVYANRMGNGDEQSQDGYLTRGGGYLQITGTFNYQKFIKDMGIDKTLDYEHIVLMYPTLLAAWYWGMANLNKLADRGVNDKSITAITRVINNGVTGLCNRIKMTNFYYTLLTEKV